MNSRLFEEFVIELKELKECFIGNDWSVGSYSKSQIKFIMAYVVLCHATIEDYFEKISLKVLTDAHEKWKKHQIIHHPIACVLAYHSNIFENFPKKINLEQNSKSTTVLSFEDRLNKVITQFNYEVRQNNHGIKEENILKLFLPVGISANDFDQTWISTIESFAVLRGEAAHTGSVKKVINHEDLVNLMAQIESGIVILMQNLYYYPFKVEFNS